MVYSLLCHSFVATEEKNNFIGIHNVTYTHCARLWERDYNKLIRIYRYREKNLSAPIRLCIREDDLLVRLFAFSLKRIYFIVCNVSLLFERLSCLADLCKSARITDCRWNYIYTVAAWMQVFVGIFDLYVHPSTFCREGKFNK